MRYCIQNSTKHLITFLCARKFISHISAFLRILKQPEDFSRYNTRICVRLLYLCVGNGIKSVCRIRTALSPTPLYDDENSFGKFFLALLGKYLLHLTHLDPEKISCSPTSCGSVSLSVLNIVQCHNQNTTA